MKHATVKLGIYEVPLIGIPPEAGQQFRFDEIEFNGRFLCLKCRQLSAPAEGEANGLR